MSDDARAGRAWVPGTTVTITTHAWSAIAADVRRSPSHERCGLLLGRGAAVRVAWPARNVSASPAVRYDIDPADHFAALRQARAVGLDVIGAYHSHPRSQPLPSPTDLAEALPGFLYVIVGPARGLAWQARAFVLEDGNFRERALVFMA